MDYDQHEALHEGPKPQPCAWCGSDEAVTYSETYRLAICEVCRSGLTRFYEREHARKRLMEQR